MSFIISGIQQVGIGVSDVDSAWAWYRRHFGMDIPVFREAAAAPLMTRYTGGDVHTRDALLALNLQGGGGMEVWQFTSRTPAGPSSEVRLGDLGILAARIKARDVASTWRRFRQHGLDLPGSLNHYSDRARDTGRDTAGDRGRDTAGDRGRDTDRDTARDTNIAEATNGTPDAPGITDPAGREHFFVRDPSGNLFDVVSGGGWFSRAAGTDGQTGGPAGCMIGVSDVQRALPLYGDLLGYDRVVYDETGAFEDFRPLPGGNRNVRRVLLAHTEARQGPFSELLGPSEIELVQALDDPRRPIFADRYWGDLGFIHLCFDVTGMQALKKSCAAAGFPLTIDSEDSFDMGEAAGRFAYIEDPDGTLIEFVETHKMPLLKKFGWHLDLRKREPSKPLPKLMIKALSLYRVKD